MSEKWSTAILWSRGPTGSRFYRLKNAVTEGILGKNTSLHNIYLIFIWKLDWIDMKMQCIKYFNSTPWEILQILIGEPVLWAKWFLRYPPPPHLDYSLDLYWTQWPPRWACPGAEFRLWAENLDPCEEILILTVEFWKKSSIKWPHISKFQTVSVHVIVTQIYTDLRNVKIGSN